MDQRHTLQQLFPLQDGIIQTVISLKTGFYLTGGTAVSRGYLQHRFSDDLDFFVNDDRRFTLWADQVVHGLLASQGHRLEVLQREERYVRLFVNQGELGLKVEMVNDVPSHIGEIRDHPVLGRLDSPENILANKISALLSREEPKDLADVWGLCCRLDMNLVRGITDAQSKAAGVFPADLARVLCSATETDWQVIDWIEPPPCESFLADLRRLGEGLIL